VNEPMPNPDHPRDVFAATPREIDGGCLKPLAIGCGALGLFLGIALFALMWRANDLLIWTLDLMETQIVSVLPEQISPEQEERLHQGLAAARQQLTGGQIDAEALQRLQTALIEYSSQAAGRGLTTQDIDRLIEALEHLDGRREGLPRGRSPDRPPSDGDTDEKSPVTAIDTA